MHRADAIVIGLSFANGAAHAAAVSLAGRVVRDVRASDPHDALAQCDIDAPLGIGVASDVALDMPGATVAIAPACMAALAGSGVAEPSTLVMLMGANGVVCMLQSRIACSVDGVDGPHEMDHAPGYHGYRFAIDALDSADDARRLKRIVEQLRDAGVPVRRFVAVGDDASPNQAAMQAIADVMRQRVAIDPAGGVLARGAAALAAAKTGRFASRSMAIHTIADPRRRIMLRPDRRRAQARQ
jgi:ribulose kinase